MPELIDRQAALKKMCETCGYCERLENAMHSTHPDFVSDKCNMYKFLAEQPTIEPKRGKWKFLAQKNGYLWKCSACKGNFDQQYRFCPYCGALMEGGVSNAAD